MYECCNQSLLHMNVCCVWMLHLLRSMFAAYECQLCMTVEFVVTDICCDRYLLRLTFVAINVRCV